MIRRSRPALLALSLTLATLFPAALSGQAVTLVQTAARFAGTGTSGFSGDFGSSTSISLNTPSYLLIDPQGNEYISDTGNNCVRKVDTSGNVTTVAGLAQGGQGDTCNTSTNATPTPSQGLLAPEGLAMDAAGNLYIADSGHNCIRRLPVGATGTINLLSYGGTCGVATTLSRIPQPNGLAIDPAGYLYISIRDTETTPTPSVYQVVRESTSSTASVATNLAGLCVVAGTPSTNVPTTCSGINDGVVLAQPSGLAVDVGGNLYVADTGNNCVRQLTGVTTQTTIVGKCTNDSTGSATTALTSPYGIAFSIVQALFISESTTNQILRFAPTPATLTLAAGLPNGAAGSYNSSQDGTSALNVPLTQPLGLAVDSSNNVYVADSLNSVVRQLNPNYTFPATPVQSLSASQPITFVVNQSSNLTATAGPDYLITSNTCSGALTPAANGLPPKTCQVFVRFLPTRPGLLNSPLTISDSVGGGLVATGMSGIGNGSLGLFAPGVVNTIASGLNAPTAVATNSAGNAYVLEKGTTAGTADVRIISANGGASTLAVKTGTGLVTPTGIASDAAGNWYIVDSNQGTVSFFGANGTVNTSYVTGLIAPSAIYVDGFGNLYIAQQGTAHNVIEVYQSGIRRTIAGSGTNGAANNLPAGDALFVSPAGLFIDLNGVLYIADSGGHRVYAIDTNGIIHLLAGNGTTTTTQPGIAVGTALVDPTSIAVDAASDVYIADQAANTVYAVYSASASGTNIGIILGTGVAGYSGDGGPSPLAQVNGPLSVAVDPSGNLFVVDGGNNAVREITYPSPTINFGTVTVNTTSPVMTQYFGNIGNESLNLLSAISTTESQFAVNGANTTCGTSILSGSVCGIGFTFTPTTTQTYTAQSVLSSNSYNSPEPVTLTGNGRLSLTSTFSSPAETEVYGAGFPELTNFPVVGSNPAPTGTLTYSVGGKTLCSITGTLSPSSTCNATNSGLSVGNYTVTVTYSGDTNYVGTTTTTTLTVTPAPLTVTVTSFSRAYGQPNPTLTGTVTGATNGDTILAAYSTTATQTSPVGTYPITATLTAVAPATLSNYTVTNTPGTLTITKATLTATVVNVSRQYGQPNPTFTTTVTGAAPNDTFSFNYSTTATQSSPVGTYPITATIYGSNVADYTITIVPGTLTVTPAPLTVNVASFTRPYGTANPTFTATIVGAVNGDTFTNSFSTTATITSAPGAYPITDVISGTDLSDYTVTYNPGTLTITKTTGTVTVTVNNVLRLYGAANPTFTSTVSGALNGDTFTITYATTATVTSPVGTYTIVPTVSGPATANYTTITTVTGTLTVTPAPLTVTANNVTQPYGTAIPAFTNTTTGLLNGDTVTVTDSTTATQYSPVGTYPIVPTVTGAALSNYTLTAVNGTLTITAAALTVTVTPGNATRIYGTANPPFTYTLSGAVGTPPTVTLTTTATITSPVGTYPITATLSGSGAGSYTVTVVPAVLTVTAAPTTTSVATSATPVQVGTTVTFTATVTSAVGVPPGTVNFYNGGTLLGSGTVSGTGMATYSTSALPYGIDSITATYVPNTANFSGSSSGTLSQVIAGTFTLTATPPNAVVHAPGSTVYTVIVTSQSGFNGPVALTCAGLPADAGCSFNTPTVTLTAGGTATVQMTVTPTVADAALRVPASPTPVDLSPITAAAIFPVELSGFGVLFAGIRRRKMLGAAKMRLLLLILCSLGVLGLAGCGCPTSVFKTYTITITGTSTAGTAPTASTTVLLSVGNSNE